MTIGSGSAFVSEDGGQRPYEIATRSSSSEVGGKGGSHNEDGGTFRGNSSGSEGVRNIRSRRQSNESESSQYTSQSEDDNDYIRRISIQEELLNQTDHSERSGNSISGGNNGSINGIDASISSLTLGSGLGMNHSLSPEANRAHLNHLFQQQQQLNGLQPPPYPPASPLASNSSCSPIATRASMVRVYTSLPSADSPLVTRGKSRSFMEAKSGRVENYAAAVPKSKSFHGSSNSGMTTVSGMSSYGTSIGLESSATSGSSSSSSVRRSRSMSKTRTSSMGIMLRNRSCSRDRATPLDISDKNSKTSSGGLTSIDEEKQRQHRGSGGGSKRRGRSLMNRSQSMESNGSSSQSQSVRSHSTMDSQSQSTILDASQDTMHSQQSSAVTSTSSQRRSRSKSKSSRHRSNSNGSRAKSSRSKSRASNSNTTQEGQNTDTTPNASTGNPAFIRNSHYLQQLQRRLSNTSSDEETSSSISKSETIQLLQSLQETNLLNESTIEKLQRQLTEMTNERNAFRTNSERVMEVMTKQKDELQSQLKNERKGFATITKNHKNELKEWMTKASNLSSKVLELEGRAHEREMEDEARGNRIQSLEEEMERLVVMQRKKVEEVGQSQAAGENVSEAHKDKEGGEQQQQIQRQVSDFASSFASSHDSSEVDRNLQTAILELSTMEAKYASQLQQQKSQISLMTFEVNCWKGKHDRMEIRVEEKIRQCDELERELAKCKEAMKKEHDVVVSNDSADASDINDELVERICELAEENGKLVDQCKFLEAELEKKSTESENPPVISKDTDQPRLSSRLQKLESDKASLEASIRQLIQDLEYAKEDNIAASATIKDLRFENEQLLASTTTKGKKKEKIDNLVHHLRGSFTSTSTDSKSETPMTELEHTEALAMIEEMQAENDTLRQSMEEAVGLAGRMNDKMTNFVQSHEATVKNYEDTLNSLREELMQERISKEAWDKERIELSKELTMLKDENDKLNASVLEANSLVETAEECVGKLSNENKSLNDALATEKGAADYLREEIKTISNERTEAYEACNVLQEEINLLRQSLGESKERAFNLSTINEEELIQEDADKLKELLKTNERLAKDLEEKNEAMLAVKAALDNLKAEQTTIKETVVALRQENARLRDDGEENVTKTPPQLKSILKPSSHKSAQDADVQFDARLKKIEKENRGLKEANATLSTKLFDEMEKTDALRIANEGLAARICKLVAYIQKNPVANK